MLSQRKQLTAARRPFQGLTRDQIKKVVEITEEMKAKNNELRQFLSSHFYHHNHVKKMNEQGKMIIQKLFEAFKNNPQLLPKKYWPKTQKAPLERIICDYIAGMTDTFAEQKYDSILD